MKRIFAIVLALALMCSVAVAEKDPYRFTFVCPLVGNEYFAICYDGIKAADAEFGADTQMTGTPSGDFTEMVNSMEAAIAAQVDGIMLPIHMSDILGPVVEKATAAGIPVVTIDADYADCSRIAFAGTDPYQSGYAAGEAMAKGCGGKAKIGVLLSAIGQGGKIDIQLEGFKDAISQYDMEIIVTEETDSDLLKATEKTQAMVLTYPEMNAVFGMTAYDVQGAAKVVQEYGLEGMTLVGFDDLAETLSYIREGVIYATIVQDPYMMGYLGVKLLSQIVGGETLEETVIDTGTIVVTKDNVDSYRSR